MNKVILMGRLTRDPDVRYTTGENPLAIARYTLAVDRRFHKDGEATADFISCVVFGRAAEFAEKYFRQGLKITISGRIQTGSYTNREGQKVYTTEIVVEEHLLKVNHLETTERLTIRQNRHRRQLLRMVQMDL